MTSNPHTPASLPLTRVVLADDHQMIREALARILEEQQGIAVVAQARSGAETIDAVRQSQPEVIVLDYSMPKPHGPELIERLLQICPDLKILVLTVHENIHYAVRVLESGAHGYLIKSAAVDELVEAINTVRQGRVYLSSAVSQEVLQHLRQPRRERVGLDALSPREFAFLRLLASGLTLQECSSEMVISTSTASTYRTRVMEKLKVKNTAELIRFALEHGISD